MLILKSEIEGIEIDLVGLCNLECPLCTRNYAHANHMLKKNIRPVEDIIKQLDTYTGLQSCCLAGAVSEPTMYKYFFELLEYLNSREIKYEIYTNGNTHDEEWWEQLGRIIPEDSMIVFTICGSTQALHEKYRVGSDLDEVLRHAKAYRSSGKTNDYIQYLVFEYNNNDLINMDSIFSQFNNKRIQQSDGAKRLTDYVLNYSADIKPNIQRDTAIKQLYKIRPKNDDGKKYEIQCRSLKLKTIYMNQFGQVSPCYINAEFEQNYFIDDVLDYTDVLNFKYSDCYMCEKRTSTFIDKLGLPPPVDKIRVRND
jgi:MoaA/NifB/PqqE/SkfB family radical SAM enzyme